MLEHTFTSSDEDVEAGRSPWLIGWSAFLTQSTWWPQAKRDPKYRVENPWRMIPTADLWFMCTHTITYRPAPHTHTCVHTCTHPHMHARTYTQGWLRKCLGRHEWVIFSGFWEWRALLIWTRQQQQKTFPYVLRLISVDSSTFKKITKPYVVGFLVYKRIAQWRKSLYACGIPDFLSGRHNNDRYYSHL